MKDGARIVRKTYAREYRCCMEVGNCSVKFLFLGLPEKCITLHEDNPVLTAQVVLETAGDFLTTKEGKKYRRDRRRNANE